MAFRLVTELVARYDAEVVVIMPSGSTSTSYARRIAALPAIRVVEAAQVDEDVLRTAGVPGAQALALVAGDDVHNIHAALAAQDLNPGIRLVIRMGPRLGVRIRTLFTDCAVLSASQMAAPSLVAAALGEAAPSYVELDGRTLYAARRDDVAPDQVVCGLAGGGHLLPADYHAADLVLASADGEAHPLRHYRRSLWLRRLRFLMRSPLVLVSAVVLGLVLLGAAAMMFVQHKSWGTAMYESLMDAASTAQLDDALNPFDKAIQLMVTYAGLALIPLFTAVAVDGLLRARLAEQGPDPTRLTDHVVVVGLGAVGTRVMLQLYDLGIPTVGVDSDENARGIGVARGLGIPVVFGDATWADTLAAASVDKARSLLLLSSNDVVNLEAALIGGTFREDLRVVLRLFDDDLAERVERRLGLVISRSVSQLAAGAFAAAMVERQVLGTMAVGRSVLMIAEVPVYPGCALDGVALAELDTPGGSRVIAINHRGSDVTDWQPRPDYRLVEGDAAVVVATRAGLGQLLARSMAPAPQPDSDEPQHLEVEAG